MKAFRHVAFFLAPGLLLILAPVGLEGQDDSSPPVVRSEGAEPRGVLPVNPDDQIFLRRARPDRRDRAGAGRVSPRVFFPISLLPAQDPRGTPVPSGEPADGGRAGNEYAREPSSRGAPAADSVGDRSPVSCFEVSVRLAEGGIHRLRVDGHPLDARTPGQLEDLLRDRMASEGALAVEGLDGASLHLLTDRVAGVRVEPCASVRIR